MMPNDQPHRKTSYHYFRLWVKQGTGSGTITPSGTWPGSSSVKKPRPLQSSIAKAFAQLANPDFVA
ncbi:hypothetical protein [Luteolibacter marinus]|uniref:hypothetical protein n=1 Tax=Luteolibacter marinus TaxID=2776705 RepID=UPI003CCDE03E